MRYDLLIVGTGPAGLAAAIHTRARGRACLVLGHDPAQSPLAKAERVDNYPGLCGESGGALLRRMREEAVGAGAAFKEGRVLSVMPVGDGFAVAVGADVVEGRAVLLATGAAVPKPLPGAEALLGRGVSRCATCDGMLYRGRRAVVTGDAPELAEEAAFLAGIGVEVTVVTGVRPPALDEAIGHIAARRVEVLGDERAQRVEGVLVDGELVRCDAVFVLQTALPPDTLLPGLRLTADGRFIEVNRRQETNIRKVYAAGDCTGAPLQIAKAVGEGQVAADWAAR